MGKSERNLLGPGGVENAVPQYSTERGRAWRGVAWPRRLNRGAPPPPPARGGKRPKEKKMLKI